MQYQIKINDKLLNNDGTLSHRGYSKKQVLQYNPENVRLYPFKFLNKLRIKEWDYYGFTTRDFFFSATVSDIGYACVVFVYFIDFHKKSIVEETILTPFGKGCALPTTSREGNIQFSHGDTTVNFTRMPGKRLVNVEWPSFHNGEGLYADLEITQPESMDSIVMSTPIGKKRFYYNQKINAMPVRGTLRFGKHEYDMKKLGALATLDWGRGVWDYNSFWNWASASGHLDSKTTFGCNLGKGFGDLNYATENCFFINGTMTKLDQVEFNYDPSDYMKPWYFGSNDGKLELTFTPFFEREAKTNLLLIRSEVHQMFGEYTGMVIPDRGKPVDIKGIIGWAEEHFARW